MLNFNTLRRLYPVFIHGRVYAKQLLHIEMFCEGNDPRALIPVRAACTTLLPVQLPCASFK